MACSAAVRVVKLHSIEITGRVRTAIGGKEVRVMEDLSEDVKGSLRGNILVCGHYFEGGCFGHGSMRAAGASNTFEYKYMSQREKNVKIPHTYVLTNVFCFVSGLL
jgi:hypothetical protein